MKIINNCAPSRSLSELNPGDTFYYINSPYSIYIKIDPSIITTKIGELYVVHLKSGTLYKHSEENPEVVKIELEAKVL